MSNYIILMGYLDNLATLVGERMSDGYVPTGGPVLGEQGISEPKYMQAMYRPDRVIDSGRRGEQGDKMPTQRDLEDAVFEANDRHPGSASKDVFGFACVEDRTQWELDHAEIRTLLDNGCEAFIALDERKAEAVLNSAKRIFQRKVTHLRQLQQTPYTKYREPTNNADRFEMIEEHMRLGDGIMEEYYAGERARDPYCARTRPVIVLDLVDAQRIDALLESTHAQYPTEHQEAVLRFKRAVHSTKES